MFGFLFGEVAYLSDVNGIPERTLELIKGCGLLIIDMLRLKVLLPPPLPERVLGQMLTRFRLCRTSIPRTS
jgi:hypothetical protein